MAVAEGLREISRNLSGVAGSERTIRYLKNAVDTLDLPLADLDDAKFHPSKKNPVIVRQKEDISLEEINLQAENYSSRFQLLAYYQKEKNAKQACKEFNAIAKLIKKELNLTAVPVENDNPAATPIEKDTLLRASFHLLTYINKYRNSANKSALQEIIQTTTEKLIEEIKLNEDPHYKPFALLNNIFPFVLKYCDKKTKHRLQDKLYRELGDVQLPWQSKYLGWFPGVRTKYLYTVLAKKLLNSDNTLIQKTTAFAKNNLNSLTYHINSAIQKVLAINRNDLEEYSPDYDQYLKQLIRYQREGTVEITSAIPTDHEDLKGINKKLVEDVVQDIDDALGKQNLALSKQPNNLAYVMNNLCKNVLLYYRSLLDGDEPCKIEQARLLLEHLTQYQSLDNFNEEIITDPILQDYINDFKNYRYKELALFSLWNQFCVCDDAKTKERLEKTLIQELEIAPAQLKFFKIFPKNKQKIISNEWIKRGYELPSYNLEKTLINTTRQKLLSYYKMLNKAIAEKPNATAGYERIASDLNTLLYHLARDKNFESVKPATLHSPYLKTLVNNFNRSRQQNSSDIFAELEEAFKRYVQRPKDGCYNEKFQPLIEFLNSIGGPSYVIKKFNHFFNNPTRYKDPQYALESFHRFMVKKLMHLQTTEFEEKQLTSLKKLATLMHYKKIFNQFGQSINSTMTISKVPEYIQLLYACENLLQHLKNKAPEHPLIAQLEQRIYRGQKPPFPSFDADEFKTLFHDPASFLQWKNERDYLKSRKNEQADLLALETELTELLAKEKIPFTPKPFIYTLDKSADIKEEKNRYRKQKKWSRSIAKFFAWTLAAGQAALGFYALLGLIPFFGPAAGVLAGIAFFATLWSNYVLFKGSVYLTIKQFFIKNDWFNGFTSPSGKILMVIALVFASTIAGTLGIMVGVSALTALTTFAFPPGAIALVAGFLAITTFVGFTSLMYRTLARIINRTCASLERKFPEIVNNGWGIIGLLKGLSQGSQRYWHLIQTPGNYSAKGGIKNALREKWQRTWDKFWVNPTGNKDEEREKIIIQRTKNIIDFVLRPFFIIIGLVFFALATYGMVLSMHNEIVNFLTNPLKNPFVIIPLQAANWISWVVVVGVAGFMRMVFNYVNASNFFKYLADRVINGVSNVVNETRKYIFEPEYFKTQVKSLASKVGNASTSVYHFVFDKNYREIKLDEWKRDPRPRQHYWDKFKGFFRDLFSIIVNGLATGALVLKGDLYLNHAETLSDLSYLGGSRSVASTSTSIGVNFLEFELLKGQQPAKNMPLQEIRETQKQARLTTHAQVILSNPEFGVSNAAADPELAGYDTYQSPLGNSTSPLIPQFNTSANADFAPTGVLIKKYGLKGAPSL